MKYSIVIVDISHGNQLPVKQTLIDGRLYILQYHRIRVFLTFEY